MSAPLISVIIPAYNAAPWLAATLNSVLGQTVRDFEILVIDDGSRDATPEILAQFGPPVRAISQQNAGVSASRNRGLAEARGHYVAFLDADDVWKPAKLDRQLAALQANPGFRACYVRHEIVDASLKPFRAKMAPNAIYWFWAILSARPRRFSRKNRFSTRRAASMRPTACAPTGKCGCELLV